MKRTALLAVALVVLATAASAASIKNSKHDLSKNSTSGGTVSATTDQICVFCHTPHNPAQNVPLWNRTNPAAGGWQMYASPSISATAKTKLATNTFDADSISLFCMSCHDGVTALGAMHNAPVTGADALGALGAVDANLGTDLRNDHPVGFNYNTAAGEDSGLVAKAAADATLNPGGGTAFFGAAGNNIECASCHKVHDPGTTGAGTSPFLRISNTNSALCLACHNK